MSTSSAPLLYTMGTPNGFKTTIILEELKAAYGFRYDFQAIDMWKNEQKEPWFLKINPNGRIPALVDRWRSNFAVFESAAILLYVSQHYDTENKFSYDPAKDPDLHSEQLQWIFFTHGGIGPMQGQAAHFVRFAPERIPYAVNRYVNETKRLYSVLNDRLADRKYLVGPGKGKYGLADINCFPWVRAHQWVGIDSIDEFPNVVAWLARIGERPQVKAALDVPTPQKSLTKEEQEEMAEKARKLMISESQK